MARCPDCCKFVSYDEPEVEVESEDLSGGTFSASVRMVRPCGECSGELAEYTFEVEADVECPHLADHPVPEDEDAPKDEIEYELEGVEAEPNERTQTTDRNGKPIKSYRYQKSFFGVDVTASVRCPVCNEVFEVEAFDEAQASWFDVNE